ncbi:MULTISPECIES: glutamine synthetase III [unclassified Lentimicrobium]|uniref:glutamine synthetase III family protein n=1 Tax=unclassified Lentimicrobium TaxID=2677434 RepID=UPI001554BB9A|nr:MULTISPECIES: glutamine synthetase III [unclassified Lentimicrobium]NPD47929.1 glutamine synthetase type III [Lentimicrobium sp. S6]NPD86823.1 glutamine synthetase type III [Lentimicrobium sp. L6]
MQNFRFTALEKTLDRKLVHYEMPKNKPSEYYGEMTFNMSAMKEYLTVEAFGKVKSAIEEGLKIDRKVADQIAASMKAWASSKGATHYTHWFHPLTGSTAEKHDAFVNPEGEGKAIENFRGNELVQQEPDASSFPHGGIRNTFEARGYTAWDPTSPAFILGTTLCIPTIFVSYTGEALDYKTPLLKSSSALDNAATAVCKMFDKNVNKVYATLGWEQEYFLVDSALHTARPDLVLTGRTLFGHSSAKDQQLSDHYFGVIPERVKEFMKEYEIEAHRLGIPVKTRHNEVAPNQFEVAPVYEEVNLAVDHNQLIMHVIETVAKKHDFVALFHEKPYANVNGSGKHNNYSLATSTGKNLFAPGKNSKENLQFIAYMVNMIKAVNDHEALLRSSISSSGNDHRLGGHEAPPAVISVFIGSQLTKMLDKIEASTTSAGMSDDLLEALNIDVPKIPEILLDNTDRNRTSPFAFTGNKFEFRAVGSNANCAKPMIALNTILTDQLVTFKKDMDASMANGISFEDALFQVIKEYIIDSKRIRFEGNNYSDEWLAEAEKRGLSNIKTTPLTLDTYIDEKTISLFERNNVMTKRELEARRLIRLEKYTKNIQIESRILGDMATNHIIPIAIRYQNTLIENVRGLKEILDLQTYGKVSKNELDIITHISHHISEIKKNVDFMINERKIANKLEGEHDMAVAYDTKVRPYLDIIRRHVDKLELLVDDQLWPLPKYRELLFVK